MTSPSPRICVASANRWAFSQTFIRAHIERLPADITVLGAYSGGFGDAQRLTSFRIERVLNELSRRIRGRSLTDLPNPGVRRFLRRSGVQVVLAEFGPTAALLANDCQALGIPIIAHFHGYDAYARPILATYEQSYRALFATAAAIVVVSTHMRGQLENLGAPAEKLFCNPCGVDVDQFHGARPDASPPRFLAVGRFVDKKAPHVTLEAFRETLTEHAEARLVMVGGGPELAPARNLSERMSIAHAVTFPGVLPHEQVADAMRGARAFVHHAVTSENGDREGTPVSVLEAAASGLPVVSTLHGGIPDFVDHGRTGFLVNERDAAGMAEHMCALASDPQLAGKLGAAGRKHVCEHGSQTRSIARLWRIISGAMTGSFEGIDA